MKIIILLLAFNASMANTINLPVAEAEVWSIGSLYYSFYKEKNSLVNEICLSKGNSCEALKAISAKGKIKLKESDRLGGKNPGAVVCKNIYNSEIIILKNQSGDENAFCKFKDNSITSANDLY